MINRPLRIGFDLDGVILYNPARTLRPVISFFKRIIFGKNKTDFYNPSLSTTKLVWSLLHKSSLAPSSGLKLVKKFVSQKKIEAYIISARYNFLKNDFEKWLKKIGGTKYFKKNLYNKKNEQPHVYKAKAIQELELDVYIEDNWDIVKHLRGQTPNVKIYWISNILDASINYPHKFFSLKAAMEHIKKELL